MSKYWTKPRTFSSAVWDWNSSSGWCNRSNDEVKGTNIIHIIFRRHCFCYWRVRQHGRHTGPGPLYVHQWPGHSADQRGQRLTFALAVPWKEDARVVCSTKPGLWNYILQERLAIWLKFCLKILTFGNTVVKLCKQVHFIHENVSSLSPCTYHSNASKQLISSRLWPIPATPISQNQKTVIHFPSFQYLNKCSSNLALALKSRSVCCYYGNQFYTC